MNDEQNIRERAYQIWEEEGQPEGKEAEHWQRARHDLDAPADNQDRGTDSLEREDSNRTPEQPSRT